MELKPGIKIHGYTLKEFISSGATAEVWRIMDEYGNEKALKIFSPVQKVDDATLDLLIDEFKMLYRLDHPHILKSEIMGAYQKVPYIIMPYYAGSLSVEMTTRSREAQTASHLFSPWFSEDECLTLLQQIGGGLAYLHEQGILHQDVKPENILFNTYSDQIQYVLTDFGISTRIKENIARMTMPRHQSYALTPAYASPEQFSGKQDFKSDVFSLGVVLFEMCEGRLPFTKQGYAPDNYGNTVRPDFRNSNLSASFKNLILRALSENADNRPEAKEFELHAIRSRGNTITEADGAGTRSDKITVLQPASNQSQSTVSYPSDLKENSDDAFPFPSPAIKSSNPTKMASPDNSRRRGLGKTVGIGFIVLLVACFLGYRKYDQISVERMSLEASQLYESGKIQEAGMLYVILDRKSDNKEYADRRTQTANILAESYDEIFPFYNDRALVKRDGMCGYIDPNGKIKIPLSYTSGSNFEAEVAFVCKSKSACGVIDLDGIEKTEFIYDGWWDLNKNSVTLTRNVDGKQIQENIKF